MIYIYLCVILSVSMTFVLCDYKCLCNYNVEKAIYSKASTTGDVLGYMYEFDCKPSANAPKADGWSAVAFENQLGFAENDANLQTQTCPGSIPDEDKLPSKPTAITQTTIFQTTSTVQTTTKMLTQNPTVSPSSASVRNTFTTAGTSPVTVPHSTVTSTTTAASSYTPPTNRTIALSSTTVATTKTVSTAATTKSTIIPSTTTTPPKTSPTKTSPTTAGTSTTTTASTTKTSPNTASTSTTTTATTTKTASTTATALTTASTATTHTHPTLGPAEMCPLSIRSDAQRKGAQLAQFGHKCYEIVQNRVSWATAEINCQRNRGHLVDITSQQEQNFLFHFLESIKSHTVWLGLHDRNDEEKFEWTSGNPIVYTDWMQDRKDIFNHHRHDCVYMTVNGTWDDIYCGSDGLPVNYLHAYICQYHTVSGPQVVG